MASYLNVYQGNCVETFELEGKSSFRIGNSPNADVVIHGELSGGEILLTMELGTQNAQAMSFINSKKWSAMTW